MNPKPSLFCQLETSSVRDRTAAGSPDAKPGRGIVIMLGTENNHSKGGTVVHLRKILHIDVIQDTYSSGSIKDDARIPRI